MRIEVVVLEIGDQGNWWCKLKNSRQFFPKMNFKIIALPPSTDASNMLSSFSSVSNFLCNIQRHKIFFKSPTVVKLKKSTCATKSTRHYLALQDTFLQYSFANYVRIKYHQSPKTPGLSSQCCKMVIFLVCKLVVILRLEFLGVFWRRWKLGLNEFDIDIESTLKLILVGGKIINNNDNGEWMLYWILKDEIRR